MTGDEQSRFVEALAALRSNDLTRALNAAAQAVAAGSSPEPRHLLGLIWCRLGQPERGVEPLRSAADARPGDTTYELMLARALIDCGRADEVLAMPQPADEARELWLARTEAADKAGQPSVAAAAWRKLVAIDPADARAHLALARTLATGGSFDEAVTAYQAMLALDTRNPDAVGELAALFERTSRIEDLGALIAAAEKSGVTGETLAVPRAQFAFRTGDAASAKAHLDTSAPGPDPALWYRLKTRIEDRLGNAETAFAAAEAMNRAAPDRESWRTRARTYRAHLRKQSEALDPQWARQMRPLEPLPGGDPVFLLGFPRSGTTLLDTFLMGHRDIAVIEELPMLLDAAGPVSRPEDLATASRETLESVRAGYLERLRSHGHGRPVVVDKFPLNLTAGPLIHALFPGAPILFVKRHPCDPVLSGLMQAFVANVGMASFLDLADAADFYDAAMSLWTRSRELLPLNVHEVAYEDLVANPEAVLRPLITFLGLEWDAVMLDHQASARARGPISTTSYDQVTEPIRRDPVERWRRYEDQLAPVLPILLPWARRFGYRA